MDNHDLECNPTNEPVSRNALESLEAELAGRLEDCYAQVEFLQEASAAVQQHLYHDCYPSGPGGQHDIAPESDSDAGNADDSTEDTQHNYEEEMEGGEPDTEYYDDCQEEQYEEDEDSFNDWDGNDEYYG